MYMACLDTLKTREKNFENLCRRHPPKLVEEWEAMDITPKKVNGVWVSVYEAQVKNGQWLSFSVICKPDI
jgi:hypothetical protein